MACRPAPVETSEEPTVDGGQDDIDVHDQQKEEEGNHIKFNPVMSVQRYTKVAHCLNRPEFKHKLVKIVDFGCSDMSFVKYARDVSGIRHLSLVDTDGDVIETFGRRRAVPLAAHYIFRRKHPLTITIYRGNVVEPDDRLKGYDAVTAIELIEHLHPEVLDKVPSAVFGFIRPRVVVLTTPNADFNVLFSSTRRFRHWDHKFEWTRKEFADWCNDVVRMYPYSVTMHGIGDGPLGSESLGGCSQMAVFRLIDESYRDDPRWLQADDGAQPYEQVQQYHYPYRPERTSETMLCELLYYVRLVGERNHDEDDDDSSRDQHVDIAIASLLSIPKLKDTFKTEDAVKRVLSSTANSGDECLLVSKEDGRHYVRYRRRRLPESDEDVYKRN